MREDEEGVEDEKKMCVCVWWLSLEGLHHTHSIHVIIMYNHTCNHHVPFSLAHVTTWRLKRCLCTWMCNIPSTTQYIDKTFSILTVFACNSHSLALVRNHTSYLFIHSFIRLCTCGLLPHDDDGKRCDGSHSHWRRRKRYTVKFQLVASTSPCYWHLRLNALIIY